MRILDPKEVLQAGEIFDLKLPIREENGPVSYLVLGFSNTAMEVAELGGRNRNLGTVPAIEIPAPEDIKRWRSLRVDLAGRMDDYRRNSLNSFRAALPNLRFAEATGMDTRFQGPSTNAIDPRGFEAYERFEGGLFIQASYNFGGEGLSAKATLHGFDLNRLGLIPEELTHRDEEGRITSWDVATSRLRLNRENADAIDQALRARGIQTYLVSRTGANLFAQGQSDHQAVSRMTGYPITHEQTEDLRFPSLEEAHRHVAQLHAATATITNLLRENAQD